LLKRLLHFGCMSSFSETLCLINILIRNLHFFIIKVMNTYLIMRGSLGKNEETQYHAETELLLTFQ
jgi:hypothetical protein